MIRVRSMTATERAARADAMRHMLASGIAYHDVRRGMGLALPKMPRDIFLPRGHAKRLSKVVRS